MTDIKIISIDPGVMTGYCQATVVNGRLLYRPFQLMEDVDDLWRRLKEWEPRYIIIEDFEFRKGAWKQGAVDLFPVQLIGVARLYAEVAIHQCATILQKPSTGKGYYTDIQLKAKKLYIRGMPHGMDASRHLLQWFTFGQGFQFNGGSQDFAEFI